MKKASQILFLIGGIIAILGAIGWLVFAIVEFVYAGAAALMANGEDPGSQELVKYIVRYCSDNQCTLTEAAHKLAGVGVLFLFVSLFSIPAAVLSFIARKENAKMGIIITATAFALVSWNPLSIVGGVLGIVDCAVNKK